MILCCFGRTPFRKRAKGERRQSEESLCYVFIPLSLNYGGLNDSGLECSFSVLIPNRDQVGEKSRLSDSKRERKYKNKGERQ